MKKQLAMLLGAGFVFTVVAGVLYHGRHEFGDGRPQGQFIYGPDPDVTVLVRNSQEKRQVSEDLIAGRMTLVKAAARFRIINASRPPDLPNYLPAYPGRSDEERICRQVIAHVQNQLAGRPDANAVVARLESELQEHLATSKPAPTPVGPAVVPRRSID